MTGDPEQSATDMLLGGGGVWSDHTEDPPPGRTGRFFPDSETGQHHKVKSLTLYLDEQRGSDPKLDQSIRLLEHRIHTAAMRTCEMEAHRCGALIVKVLRVASYALHLAFTAGVLIGGFAGPTSVLWLTIAGIAVLLITSEIILLGIMRDINKSAHETTRRLASARKTNP